MIFSTWFPYPRNTFLLNHLRNKGVWGRDCFQQLSWVLKYRTGCWGTTRCFAWWENVPGTKQQKPTNQKTGTTFHRNLFMNPLLEHIFEIARCTFYSIIPMGSLRSDTWLIFTNGQEITCCNPLTFSMPEALLELAIIWDSVILRKSTDSVRFLYTTFFLC